ncbi:centromere protein J-like isoform X1 [Clarias gariepinus]|uniref:centromere protein J-like isoform X1 n=1 Tax=Clarias gariepinus TaxID=13013 RepID=UPI00234DC544|nr:centromere protein J-like isoform X1 [Clarias gariepinus]
MSFPAGPQSHFLRRWTASSSRAGVFLSGSPGEAGSVRGSCSSPGVKMSLEDSFSDSFSLLPVSRSSHCLSVDGPCPSSSSTDPFSEPPTTEVDIRHLAARNPQPLIDRLREMKQLQQRMQEQLKALKQEQLQKLQREQSKLVGMVPAATGYNNIRESCLKTTEQPGQSGSTFSHTRTRVSPVQQVHQQPKKVERTIGCSY